MSPQNSKNISFWEAETFYRKRDIIIVGAGFTGLWSAISLKEKFPQKTVLVIERNAVPLGASTRNAGFACFGSFTEIIADSEKIGWEKTLENVKMRFEGLQKIRKYFKSSETEFDLCGGYELLKNQHALRNLEEVNRKLRPITGLEETFKIMSSKISRFGLTEGGILIENSVEGSLNPAKLLQALLKKCQKLNVEFIFGAPVLNIMENEDFIKIETAGFALESEKIVLATNAFTEKLVPEIDLVPARGQVLVTEPVEGLQLRGTFHYDEGFYYFRNIGNRVLLGGGRNLDFKTEETSEFATTDFLQNHLEEFLKKVILPGKNFTIAYRWSGIMAMGPEKFPIVEYLSPRKICAVRLSGMGVAMAPKIGEMVAKIVEI